MPGSTNFKRFNEVAANAQNDVTYAADTTRTGGIVNGSQASSALHNKLFIQVSSMVAALADMLVAKGYVVEDGSAGTTGHDYAALQAVLANIMTTAETMRKDVVDTFEGGVGTDWGGAFRLKKAPNGTLAGDTEVDVALDMVRLFNTASPNKGAYIDFTECADSPGSKIWHTGNDTPLEKVANKDVSAGYVGKTLEKINFWNAARTFMSFFTNAATAARTYTFPNKDITVAGTDDISTAIGGAMPGNAATATTLVAVAGNLLNASSDVEKVTTTFAWEKMKAIRVAMAGTFTVSFDVKRGISGSANAQLRRNGVIVGTLRTTSSGSYETFTEDIAGNSKGDEIEIWASISNPNVAYVQNFRLYTADPLNGVVTLA